MTLTNLRADARYLVFGDSANTQYGNTDLDRNLNKAYLKYLAIAMSYCGKWQVKGTYAYIDLVAGVYKYDLISTILKFNRVEAKLTAAGSYEIVNPIEIFNLKEPIEDYKPVTPEYDLRDGYITIYTSTTIEAVTNGLKLWVQGNITALAGTSDEPDLPEPFIDLITLDAALTYCLAKEKTKKGREIERQIDKRLPDLQKFFANRFENKAIIEPEEENLY